MKRALFPLIFFMLFVVGCGNQQKPTADCDSINGSSGPYDSQKYDCPAGDPRNDDIDFGANEFNLGNLEAGVEYFRVFNIANKGTAKIFDFEILIEGAEAISNTCSDRFNPGQSCAIQIKVKETLAQDNKIVSLRIKDRTGNLSKIVPVNYNVKASYPEEVKYQTFDLDYKTKKVVFGPLKDRFNNLIKENWSFQTNRKISDSNIAPFLQTFIIKPSDSDGLVEVFLQTDKIETLQEVDSADLIFSSSKVYAAGESVFQQFSITFLNNRPTLDPTEQRSQLAEDTLNYPLNLKKGVDSQNRPLTYSLVSAPANGVISNCLFGSTFVTLVTCTYSPNPNFFGEDSFTYRVFNGESYSVNVATVKLTVQNINDAPILSGIKNSEVNEKQTNSIELIPAFDPDGDSLSYEIISSPTKGSLNCAGIACSYTPSSNQLGTDVFTYRAKDSFNLVSGIFTINLTIKQINEAPQLGGSFLVTTIEDQSISFSLPGATDPENDSLIYKIKTPPAKGILKDCIDLNNDLTCLYTPNKNVDSADTFSYVAVDSSGLESEPKIVSVAITQVNDAPEFATVYQEVTTAVNTQVSFILLSAVDPESNPISYELVTPPAQGILQDCLSTSTNLTCRYNPPTNVNNTSFSFTYLARDNQGAASGIRTVKVLIKTGNQVPVAPASLSLAGNEDEPLNFTLNQGSDSETSSEFLRYRISSSPTKGKLVDCMTASGAVTVYDITCSYIPNKDFSGTDSFSYYVVDGQGLQSSDSTVSISITNTNDAPLFEESSKSFSSNEDQQLTFSIPAAIDPDADVITYIVKSAPVSGQLSSACITGVGVLNNCTYTPNSNFNGSDKFIIEARDPAGSKGEILIKVAILPINDAPSLLARPIINVQEDILSSFTLNVATDVDTQAFDIRYELVNAPIKGVLSNCLGINNSPGINCTYLPLSNTTGVDTFTYKAFDGELYSNTVTITVNIGSINNIPFFERSTLGTFRTERGSSFTFKVETAKDIENDSLTYHIVTSPTKGSLINCFSGNPVSCTYQADSDATGPDSFVYKARDGVNNSYNNVQVNLIVDDKRIERISKLELNNITAVAQKQLTSTDKNIYSLGTNLFFNSSHQANSYFNNFLMMKEPNGRVTQLGNSSLKFKSITFNDKLYVFDEPSTGSFLRMYNHKGEVTSVPYLINSNIFYPIIFNDNIYVGSNSATLFKVNLLKIKNNDYSYFEPIASNTKLGVLNSSGIVETIGVYNEELYFSYTNEAGSKKIAKINKQDQITKVSDLASINGMNYLSEFFYYENENKTVQKIYFFAGDSLASKRLYAFNLKSETADSLESVTASISAQAGMTEPQIYSVDNNDYILYKNPLTKKILGLEPQTNVLVEYAPNDVKELIVSKDRTKLVVINNNGEIYTTQGNIQSSLEMIPGVLGEWGVSFELDRIVIKRAESNELYLMDAQNIFSLIDAPASFSIDKNFVESNNGRIFAYSPRSSISGPVFDFFEFKSTVSYNLAKNEGNQLETLVTGPTGSTYSIISGKEPAHGDLTNCMGANSSNQDSTCLYVPHLNYHGEDQFSYSITYPNTTVREILVSISIKNNKPKIDNQLDLFTFASLSDLGGPIDQYTMVHDELFLVVNRGTYRALLRYNAAEGLREISRNISGYGSLKNNDNYLFFVDKTAPQKVYQYDLAAKTTQVVFQDPEQNSSIQINDIVVVDGFLYGIAKDYGFPPVNRLLKVDLNSAGFSILPLPLGYENGLFIKVENNFFIETATQFSFFNKLSSSFIDPKTFADPIYIGKTYVKDGNTLVFHTRKQVGSTMASTLIAYDIGSKQITRETNLSFPGFRQETIATPIFHAGGSPVLLVEVRDESSAGSTVELFRATQNTRESRVLEFSGPYPFSEQLKSVDDGLLVISRNNSWSLVDIKKYGVTQKHYVLNSATTSVNLKPAIDSDLDSLAYELVDSPNYGTLTDCLGLNGSSENDLSCAYNHTNLQASAVVDSFSYRAFDGLEYSDPITVPLYIKNSSPVFSNQIPLSFSTSQNIPVDIQLPAATDEDGNTIYFLITQPPTKGSVTQCISSTADLNQSTRNCVYTSNPGQTGLDSFKVRAYDGISYSNELVVNINISNDPSPIFLTSQQQDYIPNTNGSYKIILEKALDPAGNPLTYSIISAPTKGLLSNCFTIELNRLVCTYTPTNINQENNDSFTYQATNGTYTSATRTVTMAITNSAITGALGDFELTRDGPLLIKNGITNIEAISSLTGYSWNNTTNILILPANKEYHFKSFKINEDTTIIFKPFSETSETTSHGWTRIYSQSSCLIDGDVKALGGQTNDGAAQNINATGIDGELLSFALPNYPMGKLGGTGGSSSVVQKNPDFYYAGAPTLFKSGSGELGSGQSGSEAKGGTRGKDGLSLFIKCLTRIEGQGIINLKGENGTSGENGRDGAEDEEDDVSYGGGGGAGGGNGGHGAPLRIKTSEFIFSGSMVTSGGQAGVGGLGGAPSFMFDSPFSATYGVDGEDGGDGISAGCSYSSLTGPYSSCP